MPIESNRITIRKIKHNKISDLPGTEAIIKTDKVRERAAAAANPGPKTGTNRQRSLNNDHEEQRVTTPSNKLHRFGQTLEAQFFSSKPMAVTQRPQSAQLQELPKRKIIK